MNKNLKSYIEDFNLNFENNAVYGSINDYQICTKSMMFLETQIFSFMDDLQRSELNEFIVRNQKELKILAYKMNYCGVCIRVKMQTAKGGYNNLRNAITRITSYMKEKEIKDNRYCPITGVELTETQKIVIEGFKVNVSLEAIEQLNAAAQKAEEEYQNAPNNYLKASLGAIVGGAIGAVVWIVVGILINIVSGFIALLIAYLAGLGYDKMKGKSNWTKIAIISIVTLAWVIISMFAIYVIATAQSMREYGFEGNPISFLLDILNMDEELRQAFIIDMVLSLIFGAVGIVLYISNARKYLHKKPQQYN